MSSSQINPLDALFTGKKLLKVKLGERITRPDQFPSMVYKVKAGTVRLLFSSTENKGILTLQKVTAGKYIGLSNLLYGEPCEWTAASEEVVLDAVDSETFYAATWENKELLNQIISLDHPHIIAKPYCLPKRCRPPLPIA